MCDELQRSCNVSINSTLKPVFQSLQGCGRTPFLDSRECIRRCAHYIRVLRSNTLIIVGTPEGTHSLRGGFAPPFEPPGVYASRAAGPFSTAYNQALA